MVEEINRGGRPYVGEKIRVRIPDDLLSLVDSDAAATGWNRSEVIRVRLAERYEQMRKRPSGAGGSEDA